MKEMTEQHDQAMALADDADVASSRGDVEGALRLFRLAFDLERQAAEQTATAFELEPTRSILHRSAASLALQLKEYRECERLVCRALAGDPPAEIADELREIWEQAAFSMHLKVKDFDLSDNHLVVSMWGRAVGVGFASCSEVVERLSSTQKLLYRTAERNTMQPYRDQGDVPKIIRDDFHIWASVAKAASYAFVLRVGGREAQESLFTQRQAGGVVDEVMTCMELVSRHKYPVIERRINNSAYYQNFIGLTRQIAPRGKEVTSVGFASRSGTSSREVVIVQPKMRRTTGAPLFVEGRESDARSVTVHGVLLFADARRVASNTIEVHDPHGVTHSFLVPKGLMADVVRPYFNKTVTVSGTRRGSVTTLELITGFDELSDPEPSKSNRRLDRPAS
jgi:hypothetical protein